jgi:hypothetical protein
MLAFLVLAGCEVTPLAPAPVDPAAAGGGTTDPVTDPASAENWTPPVLGDWDITIRFPLDPRDNYVRPACEKRAAGDAWFVWTVNYEGKPMQPSWGDSRVTRGADGHWRWSIPVPHGEVWRCDVVPLMGAFSGTITTNAGVGTIMGTMPNPPLPRGRG